MPRPSLDRPEWKQACSAKRTNGEPCKRWAIRGGAVCASHGGRLPRVRQRADERIEAQKAKVLTLLPAAVAKLSDLLDSPSEIVALRAAVQILERAGLVATARVQPDATNVTLGTLDAELERLLNLRPRLGVKDGATGGVEPEATVATTDCPLTQGPPGATLSRR